MVVLSLLVPLMQFFFSFFFLFSAIPFINSIAEVHTVLKTELFYHF